MLLDKFEDGKRYRFTKEKYLESYKPTITPFWVDEIDQKEVLLQHEECGCIEGYLIRPSWCEEIIEEDEKMLLDKFEDGKRYRFNKELFISYIESKGWDDANGWDDDIHLQEVTILGNRDGKVWFYMISPEWCEEIIEGDDSQCHLEQGN